MSNYLRGLISRVNISGTSQAMGNWWFQNNQQTIPVKLMIRQPYNGGVRILVSSQATQVQEKTVILEFPSKNVNFKNNRKPFCPEDDSSCNIISWMLKVI